MGKVEKLIVLSVLFLIAVILVVSLTIDDPLDKQKVVIPGAPPVEKPLAAESNGPPSSDPAGATLAQATTAAQPAARATPATTAPGGPGTQGAPDQPAATSTLLSANVATQAPVRSPESMTIPAGSMLTASAGLQDSFMPDMKFYTWQSGDSFRSIAAKFYGDATKVTMLRRVNEDRYDVTAGEKILVPVFDLDAKPDTNVFAGASAVAAAATAAAAAAPAKTAAAAGSGARVHVVREGESLWKIAKQELGAGARWNEIYAANRDVLSSPEALHTGLKLRIP